MPAPVYFASGSNTPADIRGFAACGHAIGVAAIEVSANAEAELMRLAGTGLSVFVDSGAFSEIEFTAEGPKVVRPLTVERWAKTFALYRRLAVALGRQLYVVAPDRIGDQAHTLALLTRYAAQLAELAALGANVLVPIQKGALAQADFARAVERVLPFAWTAAIPSKKNATTLAELEAFLRDYRPARVHLLGLGVKNRLAPAALALCERYVPEAPVSVDSNLIAANVGRGGRVPRRLTRARDEAVRLIGAGLSRVKAVQELAIILAFGSASAQVAAATPQAA